MKTIRVYGASDDLVEIEGYINDEIPSYDCGKMVKASDGTVARISYAKDNTDCWRIKVIKHGNQFLKHISAVSEDGDVKHTDVDSGDAPSYSDVLVFKDGVEWIRCGGKEFKPEIYYKD